MLAKRIWSSRFAVLPSNGARGEKVEYLALVVFVALGLLLSINDNRFVGAVLVVVGVGAGLTAPRSAVAAIAVAIPLVHRPVSIGSDEWSLLELTIITSSVAVGAHIVFTAIKRRSPREVKNRLQPYSISVVALVLIIVGFFSLFTVADTRYRPESAREFRWVIVEPVAAFFLFRWTAITEHGRRLLLAALVGTGAGIAIIGVIQLATQTGVVVADGVERATGPYTHPNNLALYLDRIAVLALALAVALRLRTRLLVAVAVLCGAGLAATLSRGAALAYMAGALWVVGAARARHGWRWIGIGAVLVVLLLAYVGGERLTDQGSAGGTSSRELIWSASIRMIEDRPITGVGLDQFYNQYGRRYIEPAGWPERYTSHPHNLVLDVWLRLGLAGLAVFGALAIVVVRLSRKMVAGDLNRAIRIGSIGALISGVWHGMLDNGFFLPDLAVLTWLMIALLESSFVIPNPVGEAAGV